MIYKPKTVEDHILVQLQKGTLGTTDLLARIQSVRKGTTKQALYQILRKLKKDEVVILRSKMVSLSHIWINKMTEYFTSAQKYYSTSEHSNEDFMKLIDGEKISYTFKNPNASDIFWGHAFGILSENTKNEPIYIYDPHEWFMLVRNESEKHLFEEVVKSRKQLFVFIDNKDPFDVQLKSEFDGKMVQYHAQKIRLFKKENYYVNIFGDFILEAWIDEKVSKDIDNFYKTYSSLTEESKNVLNKIVQQEGRNKISISRNKRKSATLKKKLSKYFYIIKNEDKKFFI